MWFFYFLFIFFVTWALISLFCICSSSGTDRVDFKFYDLLEQILDKQPSTSSTIITDSIEISEDSNGESGTERGRRPLPFLSYPAKESKLASLCSFKHWTSRPWYTKVELHLLPALNFPHHLFCVFLLCCQERSAIPELPPTLRWPHTLRKLLPLKSAAFIVVGAF